jgi:signal transduction histidine kinase
MTTPTGVDWISRRIRMAVGQRLLLGLAPALLAVVLVLALAYYGELGRQAPEYIVTGAGVLALLSLLLTWWNTRYLVGRLRRLGRSTGVQGDSPAAIDDLDRIEREVTRLTDALSATRREGAIDHERLAARLREQATILAATIRGSLAQVDEVRLPLHILLDARFGDLNENQEELLVAARNGADEIDAALRRLAIVADADRDALELRREPVNLNDVLRAVLPMVRASAERRGARVDVRLEPALPRVWANRAALAEAIARITTTAAEQLTEGQSLTIASDGSRAECAIVIAPVSASLLDMPLVIGARRQLELQDATIHAGAGSDTEGRRTESGEGVARELRIQLPRAMALPA